MLLLGSVAILTMVFRHCMGKDIYEVREDMLELWKYIQEDDVGRKEISYQDINMIYHGLHVDVKGTLMFQRNSEGDKCLIIFDESCGRDPLDSSEEEVFRIIQFASDEWIDLHVPWSFTHDEEYLQEKAFTYYVEKDYFKTVDCILSNYIYNDIYDNICKIAIQHCVNGDMVRLVLDHPHSGCWDVEDIYHRVCHGAGEVSRVLLDEYMSDDELVESTVEFTYGKTDFWKNMIDLGYKPDLSDVIDWLDPELYFKFLTVNPDSITPTGIRRLLRSDKNFEIAKILKKSSRMDDLDLSDFTVPKKGCSLYWLGDKPYLANYHNPKITRLLCDNQSNWILPR